MAERKSQTDQKAPPKARRSRLTFILAPLLCLSGAAGSYFGAQNIDLAYFSKPKAEGHGSSDVKGGIAFVPLEPILINLDSRDSARFLRFSAQIEVADQYQAEVTALIPRLMDVLNTYLRAVDPSMLEDRTALIRMKAQMLRRVQLVVGGGKVRDLLVMEFVVS